MQNYKIKIKGHSYGSIKTITHMFNTNKVFADEILYELPLEIKDGVVLKTHKLEPPVTIPLATSLMEHLDDINFGRQMINEYNLDFILDYWLHVPKPSKTKAQKKELVIRKEASVMEILARLNMEQETLELFTHAYSKMKEEILHLSADEQISIVFKACGIGVDAAITAYKHMSDYSEKLSNMDSEDVKKIWNQKENLKLN